MTADLSACMRPLPGFSGQFILPEHLEFLIQADDQSFDARGQQAGARRRLNQRRRRSPAPYRQLSEKAVLPRTNRSAVGGPQHQLAPAVENQDFGFAGMAKVRDER